MDDQQLQSVDRFTLSTDRVLGCYCIHTDRIMLTYSFNNCPDSQSTNMTEISLRVEVTTVDLELEPTLDPIVYDIDVPCTTNIGCTAEVTFLGFPWCCECILDAISYKIGPLYLEATRVIAAYGNYCDRFHLARNNRNPTMNTNI